MPTVTESLTALVGTFGAAMLVLTMWITIISVPVLFFLGCRFLWRARVELTHSRQLDELNLNLHRIAAALEFETQPKATDSLPLSETPHTPVHLSMFGR